MGYLQADQLLGLGAGYVSKAGMTQAQQTAARNATLQAQREAQARAKENARLGEARRAEALQATRDRAKARREQEAQNRQNLLNRARQQDASRGSGYTPPPQATAPAPYRPSYTGSDGTTTVADSYLDLVRLLNQQSSQRESDFQDKENQTAYMQFRPMPFPEVEAARVKAGQQQEQQATAVQNVWNAASHIVSLPGLSPTPRYSDAPKGGLWYGYGKTKPAGESGGKTFNLADYVEVTEPTENF